EVALRRVHLSGAVLRVKRLSDGTFDVAFGEPEAQPDRASDDWTAEDALGTMGTPSDLLDALDAALSQPELAHLREVAADNVTVSYSDAVSASNWTGDGGQLRIFRTGGDILLTAEAALLTGGDGFALLSMSLERDAEAEEATITAVIEEAPAVDIARQAPALAWLEVVQAKVSADLQATLGPAGFSDLKARLELGEGALQPDPAVRPIPFSSAAMSLGFDPDRARLTFEDVSIDSAWGSATAHGTAQLQDFEGIVPREIVGQFRIDGLEGNPGGLYDAPRRLDKISVDARLRLDPFTLSVGQAVAVDGDTTATLKGEIEADDVGWTVSLDAAVDQVDVARARELWPESLRPGMRKWIASNIEAGTLHDARWSVRAVPGRDPDISMSQRFTGGEVRVLQTFPPVTKGVGTMMVHDHAFTILVEEGEMAAPQGGIVDASGTVFRVADTRLKPARAEVIFDAEGTVTAGLSIIDLEPFGWMTKANLPVTLADGRARVSGGFSFPMKSRIRGSEVVVDVTADLSAMRTETMVEGKVLSMPRAQLRATNDELSISGAGTLGRVPFEGGWALPLGQGEVPSVVRARVGLSPEALDEFNIDLPPGTLGGQGEGDFELVLEPDAAPTFSLETDLAGMSVALPPVGHRKARGTPGTLRVAGRLGEAPRVDRLSYRAPGLSADGAVLLRPGGGLSQAFFPEVTVGDWLSGALTLTGRGAGLPPAVTLQNGAIDLRRAAFGEGPGDGSGPPLTLGLERLVISDDIVLTDMAAELRSDGTLTGAFTARMNGGATLAGRLDPSEHGARITIRAADGGQLVRDAGIFEQVRGGTLSLVLTPRAAEGQFDGRLQMADIRVQDAPTMAELLSAISLVGLFEQLDGGGLVFSTVDASFLLTPGQVIVTEASAVGSSLGLSLDGVFDIASREMDFRGVISPVYVVNRIGSFLTRQGEGLFGFNFSLRGQANNPRVTVNPLSALTPGMFREIFRRAPPGVSQ
ncbi:MAG: AsmA-like C-terminal region-containing protein, partial [Pseudomonadota bacterium]